MKKIYIYLFKDENKNEIYQLPIPPEQMITKIQNLNKSYQTIGLGEINQIRGIGLRQIYLKFILPNNLSLPFVQKPYANNCIIDKPIKYLSKFREIKQSQLPFRFIITRILPNGDEIFCGNMLVSLEDYTIYENAFENGDFWISMNLKEYKSLNLTTLESVSNQNNTYTQVKTRQTKDTPKSYTIKSGDTLWSIAKTQLNDANKWKQILTLNNISDHKNLKVGQTLTLP